ncbi:MAG: CRTAC1 family protein [Thermoanaerobaculia bacterium]
MSLWRSTAPALLTIVVATAAIPLGLAAAEGPSRIAFREVSEAWHLDFRHHHGGSGERYMVETVAGGVVLFDYDDDGDLDVFFVDGGRLPGYQGEAPRSRLFRNDGPGRFVDVTDRSGIRVTSYGMGGVAGDVDGDGDLDLYVTAFGRNQLFLNRGDGTFEDRTGAGGVGDTLWSASAAFADVDRDGDLDLYVANYVDFTIDTHKFCGDRERGLQGYCHPEEYEGLPDRFYRNRGDGSFSDETAAAGLAGPREAGLGIVFGDLDGDGWPDLYVANDADPNLLFRNRGDGTFADQSLLSGTAYDHAGKAEGSMGVDLGDVEGDGDLDIVVANFEFETNALYRHTASGVFVDGRFQARIAEPTIRDLAFGVAFVDLDHDGDLDLVVANGHILDNASEFDASSRYAQPNRVFENLGDGRFRLAPEHGMDLVRVSRGLAAGDLDGDGDLDIVVVNSNDRAEVWENRCDGCGTELLVDLVGAASNTHGIGARLETRLGERLMVREVRTGASYLSHSALTAHFGLGDRERVDELTVRWPSGAVQRFLRLPAGRRLRLAERPPARGGDSRRSDSPR